jgi:hypothetical protein
MLSVITYMSRYCASRLDIAHVFGVSILVHAHRTRGFQLVCNAQCVVVSGPCRITWRIHLCQCSGAVMVSAKALQHFQYMGHRRAYSWSDRTTVRLDVGDLEYR